MWHRFPNTFDEMAHLRNMDQRVCGKGTWAHLDDPSSHFCPFSSFKKKCIAYIWRASTIVRFHMCVPNVFTVRYPSHMTRYEFPDFDGYSNLNTLTQTFEVDAHIWERTWVVCWVWIMSLRMVVSKSPIYLWVSFFFASGWYSIVYLHQSSILSSSSGEHLGGFHFLTVVSTAVMHRDEQIYHLWFCNRRQSPLEYAQEWYNRIMWYLFLLFRRTCMVISIVTEPVLLLPALNKCSPFSTSTLAFKKKRESSSDFGWGIRKSQSHFNFHLHDHICPFLEASGAQELMAVTVLWRSKVRGTKKERVKGYRRIERSQGTVFTCP